MENDKSNSGCITGVTLDNDYILSAKKLGKAGWLIPMDLPVSAPIDICKEPEKINEIMAEYYSHDIQFSKMVGELIASKIAKNHRAIILQAYCAYKSNLFSICISSLSPLYEGFLANLTMNKQNINLLKIVKEIKMKCFDKEDTSLINQGIELFYFSLESFLEIYTQNIPFINNQQCYTRHNIAHGRVYINDDKLEVIKTFSNLYNIAVYFSDDVVSQ